MSPVTELNGRLVVLFDGHCGLCNRAVRWLLRRDRLDRLRFAAAESLAAAPFLARHAAQALIRHTIVVVLDTGTPIERVLTRSDAVLAFCHELPSPWPRIAAVLAWVPRPARDLAYRLIARLRYRIWPRLPHCPLPTPAERARFL